MEHSGKIVIHVSHLQKSFKQLEVLKDISVDVKEGEVVVIIGPSGSGKSTFLRCLNRLEESSGGEIIIDGIDITDRNTECPQFSPASGSFQMSQFFTSAGQSIGVSASASVLPMNIQD